MELMQKNRDTEHKIHSDRTLVYETCGTRPETRGPRYYIAKHYLLNAFKTAALKAIC